MCAAVQLDQGYGDAAIAEFLVEPVRAFPPSPGADSAAVLREAVSARARRRARDALLLLLLIIFGFVSPLLLTLWVLTAALVAAARRISGGKDREGGRLIVLAMVALLLLLIGPQLVEMIGLGSLAFQLGAFSATAGDDFGSIVLLTLLLASILAIDEYCVVRLVTHSFRRSAFCPDARRLAAGWEKLIRTRGFHRFRSALDRVADADHRAHAPDQADVIVHRGFTPFVGAGVPVYEQLVAFRLEPDEEDDKEATNRARDDLPRGSFGRTSALDKIDVVDLHQHIADALGKLSKEPSSLSPGGRLVGLGRREQVLIPADRLVTSAGEPPQVDVLPTLEQPPVAQLSRFAARWLAQQPREWARYYCCYRVEAWDRDLMTSCYLHIGTDQQTVYFERVYCVLLPLKQQYRVIDRPVNPMHPLRTAIGELFLLPASVPHRLRSLFQQFRAIPQYQGEVVPDRYGAASSLRELAADDDVQSYFQSADVIRYIKVIDSVLVRAMGEYLEDHGYSAVEFQKIVAAPTNDFRGATFNNSAVGDRASVGRERSGNGPAKGQR